MNLSPAQLSFLRSRAHPLDATVQLGKAGVSEGFMAVFEQALAKAELVKIRVGRHVEVDAKALAADAKAVLVQRVGRMIVFYRPFPEPQLELPRD